MNSENREEAGSRALISILCPLFRACSSNWIKCESHVPDSEVVEIRFKHESRCTKQKQIFCGDCYERCEHYRSWLHMKWTDEE